METKIPYVKRDVIQALVDQGWSQHLAEEFVTRDGAHHVIEDEIDVLEEDFHRVQHSLFPKMTIAPLIVCLYDSKLYRPRW